MESSNGYIRVSRDLLDSAIWADGYDAALFFYCLLRVSHRPYGSLEPGQFYTSIVNMASILSWSRNCLKVHLRKLIDLGMISVRDMGNGVLISILDWESLSAAISADDLAGQNLTGTDQKATRNGQNLTTGWSKSDHKQEEKQEEKQSATRAQQFEFWFREYPRRNRKSEALKAWMRLDVSVETLTAALRNAKCSSQWLRENGRYIPAAVKFLDGDWENYVDHEETEMSKAWTEY